MTARACDRARTVSVGPSATARIVGVIIVAVVVLGFVLFFAAFRSFVHRTRTDEPGFAQTFLSPAVRRWGSPG